MIPTRKHKRWNAIASEILTGSVKTSPSSMIINPINGNISNSIWFLQEIYDVCSKTLKVFITAVHCISISIRSTATRSKHKQKQVEKCSSVLTFNDWRQIFTVNENGLGIFLQSVWLNGAHAHTPSPHIIFSGLTFGLRQKLASEFDFINNHSCCHLSSEQLKLIMQNLHISINQTI